MKAQLSSTFEMKDLGVAKYILGVEISRDRGNKKLCLSQSNYVDTILKRFNMHDSKPINIHLPVGTKWSLDMAPKSDFHHEEMFEIPYASVVGSLMYAVVCTKLDIAQVVGVLSRFMSNHSKEHWTYVKRVFRYLRGTSNYCLVYHGANDIDIMHKSLDIQGFVDLDWAGDLDS